MALNLDVKWTDERVARLRELHADGFSAASIAFELGVTRNAVIGKSTRLGLAKPERVGRSITPRVRVPRINQGREFTPAANVPLPTPSDAAKRSFRDGGPLKLLDDAFTSKCCKWPLGHSNSPDFAFCAAPRFELTPYCVIHRRIATVSPTSKKG